MLIEKDYKIRLLKENDFPVDTMSWKMYVDQ